MWSGSPATESIQAGLETVESLNTPVDDDIDSLERAYKQNNDLQIGEKDNFGNEAIVVVIANSITSSGNPIQQNLSSTRTPTQQTSSRSNNKRQEDKLLVRKWRKCWEVSEIKDF